MKPIISGTVKKSINSRKFSPLAVAVSLLLLSSCSAYQYVSVDSYLGRNDNREFVYENDTALIRYSFAGYNLPVTIVLHNRLNQPLYFDSERSTVVINDEQITDAFYVEGQPRFVSPGSYITIRSNQLMSSFIETRKDTVHKAEIRKSSLGKVYSYSDANTPVDLRVILALTANDDYSNPTFFDYSFWISDILQSSSKPTGRALAIPNQFYFTKRTGAGKFFEGTGIVLLVVLGAMIAPEG